MTCHMCPCVSFDVQRLLSARLKFFPCSTAFSVWCKSFVMHEATMFSVGESVSDPYTRLKDVSLMAHFGVIFSTHGKLLSSSAQLSS